MILYALFDKEGRFQAIFEAKSLSELAVILDGWGSADKVDWFFYELGQQYWVKSHTEFQAAIE